VLFGLAALVVALVGLVRGHVSWARIVSRKTAATTAVAALVVISVGGALSPSEPKNSATSSALPLSASPAPATPTPTPTPTPRIRPDTRVGVIRGKVVRLPIRGNG